MLSSTYQTINPDKSYIYLVKLGITNILYRLVEAQRACIQHIYTHKIEKAVKYGNYYGEFLEFYESLFWCLRVGFWEEMS